MERGWYTQREWERVVGWGTVPEEYTKEYVEKEEKDNGKN